MTAKKIAVLPGDGIGPEVMAEAIKALERISKKYKVKFDFNHADIGGIAYDGHGTALPKETLRICENSDAILFGSVGGPKWDNLEPEKRVEKTALLGLRRHFDLFANLRPAFLYSRLHKASPLKQQIVKDGFDILIVRELSSGEYFGKHTLDDEQGFDEIRYSKKEVERIAKIAFEAAMKRRKHVVCVDKSNVLSTSVLFRKTVGDASKKYPSIKLESMYIDNAAMQLIKRPGDFDVIVTTNLFGDILSDEAAMLTGSIGMLPSASLNEKGFGMYEPAGGSAPDIAGKGIANPIAQILSAALLMRYSFKMEDAALAIENAVKKAMEDGYRTRDMMEEGLKCVNTKEMGDIICERIC